MALRRFQNTVEVLPRLDTSRVVGFQYANGWLTGVPGYASSIGYHPKGMLASVVHTDGTTYAQAADPNGF